MRYETTTARTLLHEGTRNSDTTGDQRGTTNVNVIMLIAE